MYGSHTLYLAFTLCVHLMTAREKVHAHFAPIWHAAMWTMCCAFVFLQFFFFIRYFYQLFCSYWLQCGEWHGESAKESIGIRTKCILQLGRKIMDTTVKLNPQTRQTGPHMNRSNRAQTTTVDYSIHTFTCCEPKCKCQIFGFTTVELIHLNVWAPLRTWFFDYMQLLNVLFTFFSVQFAFHSIGFHSFL